MTSTTMELADEYGNQRMTDGHHDLTEDHPHTLKARDALEARVKELERDASRYRWLRDQNAKLNTGFYVGDETDKLPEDITWVGADLDSAIDRAMSEAALTKMRDMAEELKLP